MRFTLLCSIALGADVVVSSACKPRQSTDSAVSVLTSSTGTEISSATSTDLKTATTGDVSSGTTGSATSTELKGTTTYAVFSDTTSTSDVAITITASTDLSTSAVTLTSAGETTTETMTTEPSSTDFEESTTTLSEADTTTLAETTTTGLSETTTTAASPLETFNLFTDRGDWGVLMGSLSTTNQLGFQREGEATLPFAIEPETSLVRIKNLYLCIQYDGGLYGARPLQLCDESMRGDPSRAFLTCQRDADDALKCSVPAAICQINRDPGLTECETIPGPLDRFYLDPRGALFLGFFGRPENYWDIDLFAVPTLG